MDIIFTQKKEIHGQIPTITNFTMASILGVYYVGCCFSKDALVY